MILPSSRKAEVSPAFVDFSLTALALLLTAVPGGSLLSFLLLAYNIWLRQRVFQSLVTTIMIVNLNPGLFQVGEFSSLRWGLIFLAALRVFTRSYDRLALSFLVFVPYLVYVFFHSLSYSMFPDLSLTKLIVMTVGLYTITLIHDRQDVSADWLALMIGLFTVLSLPTLLIRSVGFAVNGTGFQGIFSHPQSFGVVSAMFLVTLVLTSHRYIGRQRQGIYAVIALLAAYVVLSEARTGMFAVIIVLTLRELTKLRSRFSLRRLVLLLSLAVGVSLGYTTLAEKAHDLILKRSGEANIVSAAVASRGVLIKRSLKNIEDYPWRGIGFGVASDLSDRKFVRDPIFNLPISAPIEKGLFVTASYEELGYVGGTLLLLTLTSLAAYFLYRRALGAVFMAVLFIAINFGEMVMFSFGALGLLGWAIVFAHYAFQRQLAQSPAVVTQPDEPGWMVAPNDPYTHPYTRGSV